MIDVIESDLFQKLMPTVSYMRLDGTVDAQKRHATVQTFNDDPSIDCLLLTTHIGGLGLTLTGADTVIFVEHDWNPMKDLQAMDRAHRLGQKRVVNVYRLITKGTLEEKIMGYVLLDEYNLYRLLTFTGFNGSSSTLPTPWSHSRIPVWIPWRRTWYWICSRGLPTRRTQLLRPRRRWRSTMDL
jgi:hypothetical protein